MLLKDGDEAIAMHGLDEVNHLVDDDVFEEVFWLLHKLGVKADVPGPVITPSPLGLHPLQEIG